MTEPVDPEGGTEHVRADIAADVRAALVDALYSHSGLGVVSVAPDGTIVEHDSAFAALLGRAGADLRGTHYVDYVNGAHARDATANLGAVARAGAAMEITADRLFDRPDGSSVWLRAYAVSTPALGGETAFSVGLLTDVSAYAALAADNSQLLALAQSEIARRKEADAELAAMEAAHRHMLDTSPTPVIVHRDFRFIYVNEAAMRMFGATDTADLLGQPILDRVQPEDREWVSGRTVAVSSGVVIVESARDLKLLRMDGEKFEAYPVALPRMWEGLPAVQASFRDVTAERRAADALAASKRFYLEVLDSMSPVLVLDAAGKVLASNRAWAEHAQQSGQGPFPTGLDFIAACQTTKDVHRARALRLVDGLFGVLAGKLNAFTLDVDETYLDGSQHWFTVHAVPLKSVSEGGVVMFLTDLTDRKIVELELGRQATHDPLTGLPNRVLLQDRLERAMAARSDVSTTVALLFVDIDHFKLINDSYGHEVGDLVIIDMAERLTKAVRPGDTVARFAGDEFVVVVEPPSRPEDVLILAERVLSGLRATLSVEGADLQLSASIGVAIAKPGDVPSDLLRSADTAMFEAKAQGRDCVVLFDAALSGRARARLDMTQDLRRALENEELILKFQPIVELSSGTVHGAEALLRWNRRGYGEQLPNTFIPAAEDSGLIISIGNFVIRTAALWAAERMRTRPIAVSVNIAARQLTHPHFVASVAEILTSTGLQPELLTLEITESTVMDDPEAAVAVLDELKGLGVRLSIDDFGTGYSSLAYLHRFPVDELKVDRSFVDGLGTDQTDGAIVTSIVTLAHTLGLIVVAEGIETPVQLEQLRGLGCQRAQGFLISKPLFSDEFDAWTARTAEERWSP